LGRYFDEFARQFLLFLYLSRVFFLATGESVSRYVRDVQIPDLKHDSAHTCAANEA
jgi:hypothetical protein